MVRYKLVYRLGIYKWGLNHVLISFAFRTRRLFISTKSNVDESFTILDEIEKKLSSN
jgi:hypothetical protein